MTKNPRSEQQLKMIVGNNIRIYRTKNGINQRDLGRRIGVTYDQLQRYEHGIDRIGVGEIYLICQILDIHPISLYQENKNPREPFKIEANTLH